MKTLDDLADLASDELIEIVGTDGMDEETANEVIMAARAHWFEGEERARAARRPRRRPTPSDTLRGHTRYWARTSRKPARCAAASSRASGTTATG